MFPGDSLKRGTGEMTTGRDFREVQSLNMLNFTTIIDKILLHFSRMILGP